MLVFDIQQSESAIRTLISPVCHHRALSRVPSAIQKVLISYLFYKQQCIYVNPNQKVKHKYHIFTYLCESRKIVCANSMCLTLCDPMDCSPPGFSVHGDSPGKNTGMGCHVLLQGIFPAQGSNPYLLHLLHWQVGSLPPVPSGSTQGSRDPPHRAASSSNEFARVDVSEKAKVEECEWTCL